MRFEIAQSLNGDKVMYIARDTNGIVRLREETEEKLIEAINKYNEMLAADALAKAKRKSKGKEKGAASVESDSTPGEPMEELTAEEETQEEAVGAGKPQVDSTPESTQDVGAATVEDSGEPKKKFLQSDLKAQIEEKKARSGKKSFWDKLK